MFQLALLLQGCGQYALVLQLSERCNIFHRALLQVLCVVPMADNPGDDEGVGG
jgi:hypothetical protein